MSKSLGGRSESGAPVAMLRGGPTVWFLYNGSPGERLVTLDGPYSSLWDRARAWCAENGYYLSSWSDADDRVPDSECICDRSEFFLPGCPMHRPAEALT